MGLNDDLRAEQLGLVAGLMSKSKDYRAYPIACLALWVEPAISHKQIMFAFNSQGIVVGYVIWAYLASDAIQRLIHDPTVTLHYSEWNEGDNVWITDMLAVDGHGIDLARFVRDELFCKADRINWLRRNADGGIRKVYAFRRKAGRAYNSKSAQSYFFRLPPSAFAISLHEWKELRQIRKE